MLSQLRASLDGVTAEESSRIVIGYEPVWAIGTGLAATKDDAARVHAVIREDLNRMYGKPGLEVPVIYGGSTSPDNIAQYTSCPDVHGALIGGASLKPDSFAALIHNGVAARAR